MSSSIKKLCTKLIARKLIYTSKTHFHQFAAVYDQHCKANAFNTQTFLGNPVQVTVDNNREPVVWGYGFGLRSRLLGYFIRADWAWGVDDGIQLPRVFYLSLNLDF